MSTIVRITRLTPKLGDFFGDAYENVDAIVLVGYRVHARRRMYGCVYCVSAHARTCARVLGPVAFVAVGIARETMMASHTVRSDHILTKHKSAILCMHVSAATVYVHL